MFTYSKCHITYVMNIGENSVENYSRLALEAHRKIKLYGNVHTEAIYIHSSRKERHISHMKKSYCVVLYNVRARDQFLQTVPGITKV